MSLLWRVRRWWRSARPGVRSGGPFALTCACGGAVTGTRRARHKVVACPACGRRVFVLPASPWPPARPAAPPVPPDPHPGGWWRLPLVAAGLTLAGVVAAFLAFLPRLGRPPAGVPQRPHQDMQAVAESGQRALAEGNFFLAARELTAAESRGESLSAAEQRQLEQFRRQAELLSHLHGRSLQELVREAQPVRRPDEWQDRFRAQHLGKAVVFDDVVGRDAAGRPALTVYRVGAAGEKARVALEDLRLLRRLPLDPPQRLVFGGRLASLEREDGGGWVFHFDPDSGVLLTDAGAVAACVGPPDADLSEVLRRQQQWLTDQVPGVRPAAAAADEGPDGTR